MSSMWTAWLNFTYGVARASQPYLTNWPLPEAMKGTFIETWLSANVELDALMISWSIVFIGAFSMIAWNLPYAILFFFDIPFFDRYLLQPKRRSAWTVSNWMGAMLTMVVNIHVSFFLQFVYASAVWTHFRSDFFTESLWTLPPLRVWAWDFLQGVIIEDTIFYFVHRLLHHPRLYATFHKTHHEYKAPFSMTALYATASEFVISDLGPLFVACLSCSHASTALTFISYRLYLTTEVHSGYSFPWSVDNILDSMGIHFMGGAKYHDAHHAKTTCNFASNLYFWDWLLGTSETSPAYLERAAKRNKASSMPTKPAVMTRDKPTSICSDIDDVSYLKEQ